MVSDKAFITVCGFASLTIIEVCALFKGIDGLMLTLVVGAVAGGMGVMLPRPSQLIENLSKKVE